jgi:hypothetical protein
VWVAPPIPSSLTVTTRLPFASSARTLTRDAPACFTALVTPSLTMK